MSERCAKSNMPMWAGSRRLSKRIATIVATAIEYEIKDPPLAFVTVTDTKVTGDLHDATVYYTVRGKTLQDEPDYAGAAAALERAKGALRTKVGASLGSDSRRRWLSYWIPCPTPRTGWRNCSPAPAPRMRIWREFGRVPSTPGMRTRTV